MTKEDRKARGKEIAKEIILSIGKDRIMTREIVDALFKNIYEK